MNAALTQAQDRLQALREQHERASSDANLADPNADAIAGLQDEIADAKAEAYLRGQQPAVSKLEAQVAALRKKSAEVAATREAAQAALPVLARRIAEAEAEVESLTLAHHVSALDTELAGYAANLTAYNHAAKALLDELAKVQVSAHFVDLLSQRLARPAGRIEFVASVLVHRMQLPMEVIPDNWFPIDAWDAVSERARPLREQRGFELVAAGINPDGPPLVKRAISEPRPPAEPREVRIVVDGKAEDTGPRLVVAGLVESVTH